ncbi:MAG: ATP-dependent DNA helicase RecG [Candidatus Pacebacteria bacterium]|nr:ATP-dependent DNA helicase RecG [Candidatus Paceibacterota bacterium]
MSNLRPYALSPLFAQTTSLPKVGESVAKQLGKLCGTRVIDLLWHRPSGVVERRVATRRSDLVFDSVVTLQVKVEAHNPPDPQNRKLPYEIRCLIPNLGFVTLAFFRPKNVKYDYFKTLKTRFIVGNDYLITANLTEYNGAWQMVAPDSVPLSQAERFLGFHPHYPLTKGMTVKSLERVIHSALERVPILPEWLRPELVFNHAWNPWHESIKRLHQPRGESDSSPDSPWRQRLAFDELLAQQLALSLIRTWQRSRPGRALVGTGHFTTGIIAALPFDLTAGQKQAVDEITRDMAGSNRMQRLLQGDVGSGKTIVALLSMATATEAGSQAALIAPTELLARQHGETIAKFIANTDIRMVVLTSRDRPARRAEILAEIESGTANIIVGTHSLLSESVRFKNLGLAVIDEQHRFGVEQRAVLTTKSAQSGSSGINLLVMTATPIPRSLALTAYGDLEVSRLSEAPKGRQPIATHALPMERLDDLVAALNRAIHKGEQAYWVCPLVEESDFISLTAVETRADYLREIFGDQIALIHGKIKPDDRDRIMADFAASRIKILVATTVIEVGVDIPNATIMVIEQAERFGLAQLHQLRGRVGRGSAASHCFLLYAAPLSEVAEQRLRVIRGSQDGFAIAEQDLILRGAGEVLGTRQSGLAEYHIADLTTDSGWVEVAQREASAILNHNPKLEGENGAALRTLLYLFEHDSSIRYLSAG